MGLGLRLLREKALIQIPLLGQYDAYGQPGKDIFLQKLKISILPTFHFGAKPEDYSGLRKTESENRYTGELLIINEDEDKMGRKNFPKKTKQCKLGQSRNNKES